MKDEDCVYFLQWSLPRLAMRWEGFRKVRNQACKRVDRRLEELGLSSVGDYRRFLEDNPGEWALLDEFCRITISRFYRDRGVFDRLVDDVLPELMRGSTPVRCWSAGCASGEEPYTLAICARLATASKVQEVEILATDADKHMLDRARTGCYQHGTLKELPDDVVRDAFELTDRDEEPYCIRDEFQRPVTFQQHDVRDDPPDGPFDLILCRNLVFMYFDEALQRKCLDRLASVLRLGGGLVIGAHEVLPQSESMEPWFPNEGIYRRAGRPSRHD